MDETQVVNLRFNLDVSIEELAFAIVDDRGVDPLEVIKAIDFAVGDCDFTRSIFDYAKSELESECPEDQE